MPRTKSKELSDKADIPRETQSATIFTPTRDASAAAIKTTPTVHLASSVCLRPVPKAEGKPRVSSPKLAVKHKETATPKEIKPKKLDKEDLSQQTK